MASIVLSAAVRQNLLSLQSTATLLATTQNNLATGNKVNSALDNPTEFFTAQGLNNRASDINNLLDNIGNGVQVLQAANTGITSLQGLVDSAKSIANQVLQSSTAFTTKSNFVSAAIAGGSASNLLGTGAAPTNAVATGTSALNTIDLTAAGSAATHAKVTGTVDLTAGIADGGTGNDITFTINSQTVTLTGGTGTGAGNTFSLSDIKSAINTEVGTSAKVNATDDGSGHLILTSTNTAGATDALTTAGLQTAGLGIADTTVNGTAAVPAAADLTFDVNGQTVTLAHGNSFTATQIKDAINTQVGAANKANVTASLSGGKLVITSNGTAGASDQVKIDTFSSGDATQLGFATATETDNGTAASGLGGQTLTIATSDNKSTTVTFGTNAGQVSTLTELNAALGNNLAATVDSVTGKITISTSNDAASLDINSITGTAQSASGAAFASSSVNAKASSQDALNTRAGLVKQFNQVLQQIDATAQDSSFNGINLLNGDTLNLTFDETNNSKLAVQGVTFNQAGLGLAQLSAATNFLDNNDANAQLALLGKASTQLRSEAASLGSNLSIVQIRQDFNKNLVNVLQTGASNLTLADPNQEAANSQALSTRQSIAVSALALANQSQQSVLQLLR